MVPRSIEVFLDLHPERPADAGEPRQRRPVAEKDGVSDVSSIRLERLQDIPCGNVDGHHRDGRVPLDHVHRDPPAENDVAGIGGKALGGVDGFFKGRIHKPETAAQVFGGLPEDLGVQPLVGGDDGHVKFVLREHAFFLFASIRGELCGDIGTKAVPRSLCRGRVPHPQGGAADFRRCVRRDRGYRNSVPPR